MAVKEVKLAGRRYIVCRNEEEARKDAETRAKLLADLERKLAQGDKNWWPMPVTAGSLPLQKGRASPSIRRGWK